MKKLVILISLGILLINCKEEFLDKKPLALETEVTFYSSESAALQAINAAYDVLQRPERLVRIEFIGDVCSGDAMAGGEPGGNDQPPLQQLMRFIAGADNAYLRSYWQSLYQGIFRANTVIEKVPKIEITTQKPTGYNLGKRIVAEAKFLRAIMFFKLAIVYGGVPLFDHPIRPSEFNQKRAAMTEVFAQIEKDLREAAADLPLKSQYAAEDMGRATKGAALGLLAKVLVYESSYAKYMANDARFGFTQQKWGEALQVAEEVINSNEYWLIGDGTHNDPCLMEALNKTVPPYRWLWTLDADNCGESVFEIQHEVYGLGWGTGGEGDEINIISVYYGVRQVLLANAKGELVTTTSTGWGFIDPTDWMVEAYDKKDPRYYLSVIEDTTKIPYRNNVWVPVDLWFASPTGRQTFKYMRLDYNEIPTDFRASRTNNKYMRFADLLLLASEAAFESGDQAKALKYLNRVRLRARNSGETASPADLTSITHDDIILERRVELAYEGCRFFDMVRWGIAGKVLKEAFAKYPEKTNPVTGIVYQNQFGDAFIEGKHELFAIPQTEIDISNGVLTQNPGY